MDTLECLHTRRSVRKYTDEPVNTELVTKVLEAGRWAPSGLNNQPWRFVLVRSKEAREGLAKLTKYGMIIKNAPVSIAVLIDRDSMYNETKDHQGIGACIQNMLLAAHALGLGAVWLGEILNRADEALSVLGIEADKELMAVLPLGHPLPAKHTSQRKELKDLIIKEI
jgi:nitroreductase